MKASVDTIGNLTEPVDLIVCAGFEDRAPRAAEILDAMGIRAGKVLILTYGGEAHAESHRRLSVVCRRLVENETDLSEVGAFEFDGIRKWISTFAEKRHLLVCDITGLSRISMFAVLSILRQECQRFWLLYTEAERYYPTEPQFLNLLRDDEMNEAFFKLSKYEETEIVYSGKCRVEELPGFEGNHLPNYPLMLIAFLTFKRSRLGAILREYEASVRVLIKSAPVRADLQWRERAMETDRK